MRVALSAPGKLVLLGEYAVLFGAPAAVMAVDRRAIVSLEPTGEELWSVEAPGLIPGSTRFELAADGRVRWRAEHTRDADRLPLVEGVLGAAIGGGLIRADRIEPAVMRLDTRAFFTSTASGQVKLGLGSSAALTVTLASALAVWSGNDHLLADRLAWLESLVGLHRELQGGRGSGLDLAAALLGGPLEYRLDTTGSVAAADPLPLPSGLRLVFVWTGRAADTGDFLRRLYDRLATDDGSVVRGLDRLGDASHAGVAALRKGRVAAFLDSVDDFNQALEELGRATDLTIYSAEHLELRRLARRLGARYKPSGAGGGDLGIAVTDDPSRASAMAAGATSAGFQVIDLHPDPKGLAPVAG